MEYRKRRSLSAVKPCRQFGGLLVRLPGGLCPTRKMLLDQWGLPGQAGEDAADPIAMNPFKFSLSYAVAYGFAALQNRGYQGADRIPGGRTSSFVEDGDELPSGPGVDF